jgi:hypothetical protein
MLLLANLFHADFCVTDHPQVGNLFPKAFWEICLVIFIFATGRLNWADSQNGNDQGSKVDGFDMFTNSVIFIFLQISSVILSLFLASLLSLTRSLSLSLGSATTNKSVHGRHWDAADSHVAVNRREPGLGISRSFFLYLLPLKLNFF